MAWSEWPMRYRDIMCYPHSTAMRDSVKRVLFGHLKTLKTPSKENYCSAEEFSTRTAQIFLEGQGTLWTWFPGSFSFWESNRLKDSFPGIFCCHDKIDNDQLNQKWVSTKKEGSRQQISWTPECFSFIFYVCFGWKTVSTLQKCDTNGSAQESARKAGNVRHGLLKFFRCEVNFGGFNYIHDCAVSII